MVGRRMPSLPFLQLLLCFHSISLASSAGDDQFAYQGFTAANIDVDDFAAVLPDGLLRLTNTTLHGKGHAFHPAPLHFHASPGGTVRSFSTTFLFGIVSQFAELSAHGLALVVSSSKNFSTASGDQYLGLLDASANGKASNRLFAVEIDTILNPEFQDIDSNHIGIDINSLRSLRSNTAGYYNDENGTFENLTLYSGEAMQLWVDYDGRAMELSVTLAPAEAPKPRRPLMSTAVDLSGVVTDPAYVGFSSSTPGVRSSGSSVAARHYVLGWSFALDGVAPPLDYSKLPKMPRVGAKPRSRVLDVVLPVATGGFLTALLVAAFLFVRRRLRYAELREDWEDEFGPHRFSYKDLFCATEGFQDKQLLGIGGFGRVYRGVLPVSNVEVAVKRVSHGSTQGMKEFIAEVVSIGHIRHRNLVQLLGYCRRRGELLLVYDYMSNGSLDNFLHNENKPALDWASRYQIARDIASGLLYLHEDWETVVVHRDVKPSNVLLDDEMNGRLGDFGLAKLYDHGAEPQTTHVVGTMGYLAPELVRIGKATPLTDVFAFGVFLLEITCARRPLELDMRESQFVLMDWVLEHCHKGLMTSVVDARLNGEYDVDQASLALKLGLLCAYPLPGARPSMRQVIQYLDGNMPAPEIPPTYLSYSMLTITQNEGFEAYATSHSSAMSSVCTVSSLSGGR